MNRAPYTIVRRRYFFGGRHLAGTIGSWETVCDDRGEPVIAAGPDDARRIIAEQLGGVYHLAHNEYAAPDWGYVTPSGRVRRV